MRLAVAALIWGLAAAACGPVVELDPPDLEAVPRHVPEQTFVYDADGAQIAVLRQEFRERAAFDDLPEHLVDAVVTAEDRRFWIHAGVDARAIVRAALANRASGEIAQGGSTITQQLVKNVYMPDAPRTPSTKFREALLARRIEDETSKERILEDYLNTVYFGNGAYGVQAAAFTYFREPIEDLDLAESAMLAALIRSPESLQPARDSEGLRARRDDIIDRMVDGGLVDSDAAARAKGQPIVVLPRPATPETRHPHWVDFVVRELLEDPSFGATESERATRLFGGGLRVHTTLRPDVLAVAETARDTHLPDPTDPEVGIAVVVPDTGEILALVGGRDYEHSQFDLATQARRQPGSTFKTFVLAAALQSGYRPDSRVNGNQTTLDTSNGPWTVRNFSRVSYGAITLQEATRASVNAVFARLILELGPGRVATLARAMGIESPINEDPPIAIGGLDHGVSPLDMAAAYATLANLGERVPVSPIDRIEDSDGKVVWRPNRARVQVLEPSAAFVTTQMLRTVVEDGTGTAARVPGWEVAGKTGTVDDHTDAWFVGYTPTISVAVWVGDAEERVPLVNVRGVGRVTGGSIPARIWRDFVSSYLTDQDPVSFMLPEEYYQIVAIDPVTGLRSAPWCASEERALPRVLVPKATCPSPPPPPPPPPSPPPPCPTATPSPAPAPSPRDCVPVRAPTESPLPGPTDGADEPEGADEPGDEPAPESEPVEPAPKSDEPST